MSDYKGIVEFLRDVRMAPVTNVTDELRQYATDYAELCRQANDRLRQCSVLLQQGLRTEAIHLAEEPPTLLDLVSALDLPDAQAWAETCQQFDMPVPVPLQMDRAAQLNEAYGQDEPLEKLLKRHRLLALRRSPVKKRLEVLRQISAMDPAGAGWDKDIIVFERARLREIKGQFTAALKGRDKESIRTMVAELEQNPWIEPIPTDLQAAAASAGQEMQRVEVLGQVRQLMPALRQAFAAKSHKETSRLLDQLKQTLTAANQEGMPSEIAMEVQPIVIWVQRENQVLARRQAFDTACKEFSRALDAKQSEPELRVLYDKFKSFDEPVPPELKERFAALLKERKTAARRGLQLKMAIAGALVLLTLLGVYFYMESQSGRRWAKSIQDANVAKNLTLAQQLIQEQERKAPKLNTNPDVAKAKSETAVLQDSFDRLATGAKSKLAELTKAQSDANAVANSDKSSPQDLVTASNDAATALTKAGPIDQFAWADPGKNLQSAVHNLQTLKGDLKQKANVLLKRQVDAIAQQADTIGGGADAAATMAQLDELSGKARALLSYNWAEDSTRSSISATAKMIDDKRDLMQQARTQQDDLLAIRTKGDSADQLREALLAFVAKYPSAAQTKDFTKAAEMAVGGKAMEAWRDASAPWARKFVPTTSTVAQQRIDAIQAYLAANPATPLSATLATYQDYLKRAAEALGEKGTWQGQYADLLGNPLVTDLAYLEVSDGKRYYVLGDMHRSDQRANGQTILTTFDSIDPKNLTKRKPVAIAPPRTIVTEKPIKAAHTKVAADLVDQLKLVDETNWDTWGIDVMEKLLKNDEMDIVVKAIFLLQALKGEDAVAGWAIGDLYDKPIKDFGRQNLDAVIWYDGDHPVTDGTKAALRKIMDALPKGEPVRTQLAAKKAELFKALSATYASSGVLMRDEAGHWQIYARAAGPGQTAFGIVTSAALPTPATAPTTGPAKPTTALVMLGQFKDGKFTVDEAVARELPSGSLVLISKP